jgi:hypothetical protein
VGKRAVQRAAVSALASWQSDGRVFIGQSRRQAPGLVLAERNLGHFITYTTDCTVIGNNFILTDQHLSKLDQTELLMRLPLAALRRADPSIQYLITALPDDLFSKQAAGYAIDFSVFAWPSIAMLADDATAVDGYELLFEARARSEGSKTFAANRIYRVVPPPPNRVLTDQED